MESLKINMEDQVVETKTTNDHPYMRGDQQKTVTSDSGIFTDDDGVEFLFRTEVTQYNGKMALAGVYWENEKPENRRGAESQILTAVVSKIPV